MSQWVEYNPNPNHKRVGDCTVRALSKILCQEWSKTYIDLCIHGYMMCDMPSANNVWGEYLKTKGFIRGILPNICPECYTVKDFASDNYCGEYILALPSHVVAVIDGNYYDTWDSGDEVPLYYWYKEEV